MDSLICFYWSQQKHECISPVTSVFPKRLTWCFHITIKSHCLPRLLHIPFIRDGKEWLGHQQEQKRTICSATTRHDDFGREGEVGSLRYTWLALHDCLKCCALKIQNESASLGGKSERIDWNVIKNINFLSLLRHLTNECRLPSNMLQERVLYNRAFVYLQYVQDSAWRSWKGSRYYCFDFVPALLLLLQDCLWSNLLQQMDLFWPQ